ncbi:MAG: undecaprenyl/decaprenyl-phosphate alpha-N-acetylglucosaminyl 1-phosphate transferase [Candidatus Omnitrophica bacterium]|nr:undecaprenyl/decaprenyl-phosphate alpha-N-acetylglucosaminyl 1-phosphate transferase [Candidatus Omnitrophota bacterium]
MMIAVYSALAFLLSFFLTYLCEWLSWRFKVLDHPGNDTIHSHSTPLLGGLAIYLSFMLTVFFLLKEGGRPYTSLFFAATIIFISGLIDDIRPLSSIVRLLIQIIAASIIIKDGICFTFLSNNVVGIFGNYFLSLFWIVGMTNAFNYLDGLNGLLAGVSIISAGFFFIFTHLTKQVILGDILVIFIGSCFGFFPHNFFRNKIFMGNAGSYWIGFMLSVLAIIGDWIVESNPIDMIIPILIFAVPIYDIATTTLERFIFKKIRNIVELFEYRGKDHFHYRLSQIGLGNKGAVFFIFLVCILLGLNALLLKLSSSMLNAGIILSSSIIFFILISLLIITPYQK